MKKIYLIILCLLIFNDSKTQNQDCIDVLKTAIRNLQQNKTFKIKGSIHGTGIRNKKVIEGDVLVYYKKTKENWAAFAEATILKPMFDKPDKERMTYDGNNVYNWDFDKNIYINYGNINGKGQNYLGFNSIIWKNLFSPNPFMFMENKDSAICMGTERVNDILCDIIMIKRQTFSSRIAIDKETKWIVQIENMATADEGKGSTVFDYTIQLDNSIPENYFAAGAYNSISADSNIILNSGQNKQITLIQPGQESPVWELADLSGNKVNYNTYNGKIVILDFWATWCAPCRLFEHSLSNYYNNNKQKNIIVLGMNFNETASNAELQSYIKKNNINYPIIKNAEKVGDLFKVQAIPVVYVIGPDKKIIFSTAGYSLATEKEMYEAIERYQVSISKTKL